MTSPESAPQTEILQSIATSLKGIQSSIDRLTEAVEGVAESIETAHEPEGELGHHLVGALKDLSSVLHKRAQQERLTTQPQQRHNQPQYALRRDERPPQRHDQHIQQERDSYHPPTEEMDSDRHEISDQSGHYLPSSEEVPASLNPQVKGPRPRKPRPNRRRGNASLGPKPTPPQLPQSPTSE